MHKKSVSRTTTLCYRRIEPRSCNKARRHYRFCCTDYQALGDICKLPFKRWAAHGFWFHFATHLIWHALVDVLQFGLAPDVSLHLVGTLHIEAWRLVQQSHRKMTGWVLVSQTWAIKHSLTSQINLSFPMMLNDAFSCTTLQRPWTDAALTCISRAVKFDRRDVDTSVWFHLKVSVDVKQLFLANRNLMHGT